MARGTFSSGWNLPPGVTDRMIDEAAGGYDEPDDLPKCTNPAGHSFVCSGTAYGGDDDSYHGEGRCYCEYCGADGDA